MNLANFQVDEPELPDELKGRVRTLKIIPMLPVSNPNGDIFGGWILSQMDLAGASRAYQAVKGRIVTVGVETMAFHAPVFWAIRSAFSPKFSK